MIRQHLSLLALLAAAAGCETKPPGDPLPTIHVKGSDTMIAIATEWGEAYDRAKVEVGGGGSGIGIHELMRGTIQVATSSRPMTAEEAGKIRKRTGKDPVAWTVGHDGVAVYVHRSHPLEEISIEQLAGIFGAGGGIERWSQLGIRVEGCGSDRIAPVVRNTNSGTRESFAKAVLGEGKQFRADCIVTLGSRDLVTIVENVPCAIGFSGMSFRTERVKVLEVKRGDGPAFLPSIETVRSGGYPIARPLLMYTPADAEQPVREFIGWVRSDAGQAILEKLGEVSLAPAERTAAGASSSK